MNLVGESAQVTLSTVEKVNCPSRKALTVLYTGDNMSPAIYLEPFYEKYKSGMDIESLAGEIVALSKKERHTGKCDLSFFTDYNQASEHIICRLINYKRNRDLLGHVPYTRFLDLAIVYYYEMGECESGRAYILVQDKHMETWGIEKKQLHEAAVRNTRSKHPYRLATLTQLFEEMSGGETLLPDTPQIHGEAAPTMYVLTNEDMCFGAVNICFPELLRVIRRQIGDDFYVLPISIHECIILPVSMCGEISGPELREMVRSINIALVEPEDILSDSVYRYDMEKKLLEVAA